MERKTYIAWGAFLTAACCVMSLAGAVGHSQARYLHQASWQTVVQPLQEPVTADSLVKQDQPALINRVGTLTRDGLEFSITLNSEKNLSGSLTWRVSQSQYARVKLSLGATELTSGDVIGLSAGKPTVLTVKVEPTTLGLTQKTTVPVDLQITWKDTLTGIFRVELPQQEQENVSSPVELSAVNAFHWDAPFPVNLKGETSGRVLLSQGGEPFPAGTRYSTDGGNSWHRLCQSEQIPLSLSAGEDTCVLLDLSHTSIQGGITLGVGQSRVSIPGFQTPVYQHSNTVLTPGTPIQILLTNAWKDCSLDYRVERLMPTEGAAAYVPVELTGEQLAVTFSQGETGSVMTLTAGQIPSGTYRLWLSWRYRGICFHQTDLIFFVNHTQQTGGAQ